MWGGRVYLLQSQQNPDLHLQSHYSQALSQASKSSSQRPCWSFFGALQGVVRVLRGVVRVLQRVVRYREPLCRFPIQVVQPKNSHLLPIICSLHGPCSPAQPPGDLTRCPLLYPPETPRSLQPSHFHQTGLLPSGLSAPAPHNVPHPVVSTRLSGWLLAQHISEEGSTQLQSRRARRAGKQKGEGQRSHPSPSSESTVPNNFTLSRPPLSTEMEAHLNILRLKSNQDIRTGKKKTTINAPCP